jgi:acyl-coenzyme A thioesterase PaaI-like protein
MRRLKQYPRLAPPPSEQRFMNSDHALVTEFLAGSRTPVPVLTNPLAVSLNAQLLELDASGKAVMSFEPPETYVQGTGVLQSGTLAILLDFALAFAALAALPPGRSSATVSLTTNLLKPALPGKYIARATIDRLGSLVAFGSAVLQRADNNQTVAIATAVMPIVSSK